MIESFRNKALKRFAEKNDASKLPTPQMTGKLAHFLSALNVAQHPSEMNIPGSGFHVLTGKMKGRYSIWITGNWRLTFGWKGENAIDVDLEDYH